MRLIRSVLATFFLLAASLAKAPTTATKAEENAILHRISDPNVLALSLSFITHNHPKINETLTEGINPWLKEGKGLPLVLLGGANRTVARQELLRSGKDEFKQIHGLKLSTYMFLETYTDWLGKDVMQRKAVLGSEAPRADIITIIIPR